MRYVSNSMRIFVLYVVIYIKVIYDFFTIKFSIIITTFEKPDN